MQSPRSHPIPRLPISLDARLRYQIQAEPAEAAGELLLPDSHAAHMLAETINSARRLDMENESWVSASELYAAALLSTAVRLLIRSFSELGNPPLSSALQDQLSQKLGTSGVEKLMRALSENFRGQQKEESGSTFSRNESLEFLIFLYWARKNPALDNVRDLFDVSEKLPASAKAFSLLETQPASIPADAPGAATPGHDLLNLLLGPIRHAPDSLNAQLSFIRTYWAQWIVGLDREILAALDLLAEEHRPRFPPGPGPVEVPDYAQTETSAPEAFSEDIDWMPRVVLLAKNAYVWMAQLSGEYGREIRRLDEIPGEELDRLASRGFTALWLIGVWERSRASEKIKRWMGDEDAVASAYSLYDYSIAARLGGDPAWDELSRRAFERGIRLMTDMVPNHVGIDGRWVIEHPDWFIGLPDCPFPSYRFSGADLCEDERVGIYLEDGYWDHSDAAVVFRRVDHWTGDTRYIYHGNDGTSMPWNDTAQLDYRKEEVREAVIQTILQVARRSPMIRFDAAMTLTRENFRRLWFPEPGHGGDIPSRSAHAMSREDFDHMMPREFWREVVDRVAEEAPDTLLLAEAFWMLEGYFVRSLGMHRVYNSAFMNMLRDERNAEYRRLIRETLEFDPRILSRYVNFMSNPDEDTAVEGFGTGDKYFGICTLMATMPGLPMFGHGQIEGFAEKYGMEFHRPRWREKINRELFAAHHRLIFPLLRRRAAFSGVEHFRLYDFETPSGEIDEHVFAYSNGNGPHRSLVVVNNRFGRSRGRVFRAVPTRRMTGDEPGELIHPDLGEGLQLDSSALFFRMRDLVTGMEFIYEVPQLLDQGMELEMEGYEYHVFQKLEEIREDAGGHWSRLVRNLDGSGCPDLEEALGDLRYSEILDEWKNFSGGILRKAQSTDAERQALHLLAAIRREFPSESPLAIEAMELLEASSATAIMKATHQEKSDSVSILRISGALHHLVEKSLRGRPRDEQSMLLRKLRRSLDDAALECLGAEPSTLLTLLDVLHDSGDPANPSSFLLMLLDQEEIRGLLQVHEWESRTFFRKESMDSLLQALETAAELLKPEELPQASEILDSLTLLKKAVENSKWDLDRLREVLAEDMDGPQLG